VKRARFVAAIGASAILALCTPAVRAAGVAQQCGPGRPAVTFSGAATTNDSRTYRVMPFEVVTGTTRVEVTYGWTDAQPALGGTPITKTTIDLGVWDQHGYRSAAGFRGWSGSRAGNVAHGQAPVFIQQDFAQRGYRPDPIKAGQWWIELGFAAIAPGGTNWTATVHCTNPAVGAPFVSRPVDPTYVARNHPGWYRGDFHMHGVESNMHAPPWSEMVRYARSVGLDFMPISDYVTNQQWRELGPVQQANPDMLIWPGREIITYFGHMNAFGETPGVIEYRQGFEGISMADVQREEVREGALFQVNHPTEFGGPLSAACVAAATSNWAT
jgi:hypothetical protein